MKSICLILLFCATAFGESNYEKGRLISITDASFEYPRVASGAGFSIITEAKQLRYYINIQVADTVYVGLYAVDILHPSYRVLELKNNNDVDVRIDGRWMHLKRPNGKDFRALIKKRLDRTGKDEEHVTDVHKEAHRHNHIGTDLQDAEDLEGAETQFRAALRLEAENAETHYKLGWVLYKEKKFTEALPEFQSAVRLNSNHARAHCMVGVLLTSGGELDKAIEELSTSVRLDDHLPMAHYVYGTALETKGKLPEALEEYRRAEKLDREDGNARSAVQRVEKKLAAAPATASSENK